ncbi:YqjK-like family protein [Thiobacillus denitrificans]|uniref:YqjK-like family protein n=1 Tax=Thiobacillus denitrificans TaxID=36861 RepID=UPI0003705D4E|nr:YqjK-like family protein [Thiobacillus denitrificans]
MNRKSIRLAERRERLVVQAAAQRTALAKNLEPWRAPLALADQGVAALRYVRRRPALLVGVMLMVAVLRPKRLGRGLGLVWGAWQLGRRLLRR